MCGLRLAVFFLLALNFAVAADASGTAGGSANGTTKESLAGMSRQVTAYNNGKQAVVGVIRAACITVRFGGESRVSGSAGCNQYSAEYLIDDGSITIGPPGATRRFCADPEGIMDQEAGLLAALRSRTSRISTRPFSNRNTRKLLHSLLKQTTRLVGTADPRSPTVMVT
jgi:heat shock protein HslJ